MLDFKPWMIVMTTAQKGQNISQIHIDVCRNATDDFNLFHDSQRWSQILQNPFHGPIALGFQIESLVEHNVQKHREIHNENDWIRANRLNFSNYQFSFAKAIKPEQNIVVEIKKSIKSHTDNPVLSNRVSVKSNGKLALVGFKKETQAPLFLENSGFIELDVNLRNHRDRHTFETTLHDGTKGEFFLKRKFMTVSNAKNFLCGSLVDQRLFFDELTNKYQFSEIFPCSFISCALLEKSLLEKLDFNKNPMIYKSHKISIDRCLVSGLSSNDVLHILIRKIFSDDEHDLSHTYECYGLIKNNDILFRAIVELMPLSAILKNNHA